MRVLLVAFAVLVAACATTTVTVPVSYSASDEPNRRGIAISYTNRTGRMMCLSPSVWPNGYGFLDSPEGRVFIRVGPQRFPMKPHNTGYCIGGCPTKVLPGQTVIDFIPYERFDIPAQLASEPKQLEFDPPPSAYPCPRA